MPWVNIPEEWDEVPLPIHRSFINIQGKKSGRLTVLFYLGKRSNKHRWACKCRCGKYVSVITYVIHHKKTRSCGCIRVEGLVKRSTRHGYSSRRQKEISNIYAVWLSMRSRCNHKTHVSYPYYGGRGISYVDRWDEFENFLEDMGEPPPGNTIERIDNDKNYGPENCIWIPAEKQSRNRRNVVLLEFDGKELCVEEWAREIGIRGGRIRYRLKKGWSVEEALGRRRWPKRN